MPRPQGSVLSDSRPVSRNGRAGVAFPVQGVPVARPVQPAVPLRRNLGMQSPPPSSTQLPQNVQQAQRVPHAQGDAPLVFCSGVTSGVHENVNHGVDVAMCESLRLHMLVHIQTMDASCDKCHTE